VRTAIYPGSFDPPTKGHLDIIHRAASAFDRLIVAVGVNSAKEPFMATEDRVGALKESTAHLSNVEVEQFEGLLVNYARSRECGVLVRGLRAVSDFEYEFRIAMANRAMAPEIETLFLLARDEYSFLASSVVREVALLGGDWALFVPEPVERRLRETFPASSTS
jgi:pantetheine-phosphate adenylyltransferase